MNTLHSLSKQDLLKSTQALVTEKRKISLELIEHLREIDRRMLYDELGFSSLWDFCTRHLGLSDGATQRRISAVRLAADVPEVTESLENGKLTLSTAAQIQGFFQMELKAGKGFSREEKMEIIESVHGLSKRQCERKLFDLSPEALPRERERALSENHTELKVILDTQVVEKLKLLRDQLAHCLPQATFAEIIAYLVDETLSQLETKKSGRRRHPPLKRVQANASA